MNIWIISLYDPTPIDNTLRGRYLGIASAGNKLGHNITHFSCTFRHSTKIQRFEETRTIRIRDNYEVIFIFAKPYQKNISLKRILSHRKFTQNLRRFISKSSHPDILLLAYPPISSTYYLTKWANKNGIPVIIDIIDTWPHAFLKLSPKPFRFLVQLILFPVYYEFIEILKNCSGVIGISSQYVNWAKSYGYPIVKSGVFLPSVPYKNIRKVIEGFKNKLSQNRNGKIKLIYAGSLGLAYDIPVIMKAAEIMDKKHPGKSEFLIAGEGHYQKLVVEYLHKCNNINFLGRLDHNELLNHYASADLGLAQYIKDANQSITYKFFDYLSAGLPILNSLMTEMAILTEQHRVGFNNPPGNAEKLVENIEKFLSDNSLLQKYKENAISLASIKGDSELVYKELIEFLTSFR